MPDWRKLNSPRALAYVATDVLTHGLRQIGRGAAAYEPDSTLRVVWPTSYGSVNAPRWGNPVRAGLATTVEVATQQMSQPSNNVVAFQIHRGREVLRAALDYDDLSDLAASPAEYDIIYKMQHRRAGYATPHVVPGLYVPSKPWLYSVTGHLRQVRARGRWQSDVYGRFGLRDAADVRRATLHSLQEQDSFAFRGGAGLVTWSENMRDVARSRVVVDLPGRGSFCYRLVEYLAVGACVVALRHENILQSPLDDCIVYVGAPGDVVSACESLLGDPQRRQQLESAARDFFDANLQLSAIGRHYVASALALS